LHLEGGKPDEANYIIHQRGESREESRGEAKIGGGCMKWERHWNCNGLWGDTGVFAHNRSTRGGKKGSTKVYLTIEPKTKEVSVSGRETWSWPREKKIKRKGGETKVKSM